MKFLQHAAIIGTIFFLYSCSEDETTMPNSSPETYGSENYIVDEFRMWTSDGEVNTEDLDPEDFIEPDHYEDNSPGTYEDWNFTFGTDSVDAWGEGFSETYAFVSEGEEYILLEEDIDGNIFESITFYKVGNTFELRAGYFKYQSAAPNSYTFDFRSAFYHLDPPTVSDIMEVENALDVLNPQDTLLIYNYTVVFE